MADVSLMDDEPKYWAFISYSHDDDGWGKWLHRALERYRTPRRLVGRTSRDGTVPTCTLGYSLA
jgi:hypothetical protein